MGNGLTDYTDEFQVTIDPNSAPTSVIAPAKAMPSVADCDIGKDRACAQSW